MAPLTDQSEQALAEVANRTVLSLLRTKVLLSGRVTSQPHLDRAAAALALAEAADRLARAEVMTARERDGATWEQVGEALGVSRQSAHERFRAGPDGLHSRLFKRHTQKSEGSSGGAHSASRGASRSAGRDASK